jgi:sirohydrochlorin cobaltochelatase
MMKRFRHYNKKRAIVLACFGSVIEQQKYLDLKKIVDGFKHFSLANISCTNALLTKTKETTAFLKDLNEQISKNDTANLYVIHGTPRLDTIGIDSINYSASFLELISENNFTCSLEGAFPYFEINDVIKSRIEKLGLKKVQVVPLLLVSGNHYINDMFEIKDDLADKFESFIVPSLTQSEQFNLIELPMVQNIIEKNIQNTFKMMGISHKEITY